MKRFLLPCLTALLAIALAACGGQPAEETPPEPAATEVEGLLSVDGTYRSYTYSDHVLNDQGQVIQVKVSGDSNRVDAYEYDDQGRLVKETRTSSYGEEIWTYTYDEEGRVISEFQGDRTFDSTYTLDDQGRVLTKTSVNTDPSADYTMVYTYTYNDDGTVATETQDSGRSVYVIEFQYDDQGRVIQERSVDQGDGSAATTTYTYGVIGTYTPAG